MPEPYYQDEWVTIYHGDTRAFRLQKGARLITDPPYERFVAELLGAWVARYKTVAVFGYPELLIGWCVDTGLKPDEWVTWNPPTPRASAGGARLRRSSEAIGVFGEVLGGREVREPRSKAGKQLHWLARPNRDEETARAGDVWSDPAPGIGFNSHLRLHPNEKPLSLMRKLVLLCSNPGDTIMDPFVGSGTTLRAAKDLSRRAIGIEIEERYCEIAARRMGQEVLAV